MKKGVLIIMSVAVLGVLGMYVQKKPTSGSTLSAGSTQTTAGTATSSAGASLGSSTTAPSQPADTSKYKDGDFTGAAVDTPYGTVQVAVVVSGGKISDVQFLQMPNDQGNSRAVTSYAEPLLKQTTLDKQSANIDFVTGATSTSAGYEESLQKALDQAQA
jgi:uncharacterized protein with FMN-binding domain